MTHYQIKLIEIQNEQKALLASPDRRRKAVRERIHQLTSAFYATKAAWRNSNQNKSTL